MLPSNSRECGACLCVLPLFLLAIAGFVAGTLFYMLPALRLVSEGYPLAIEAIGIGAAIYIISSFLCIISRKRWSEELTKTKIVGISLGHKKIGLNELSQMTGQPINVVQEIMYNAIACGALHGTIEEMTFIRQSAAPGTTTVEREVMVTRKVPENCFKCGASINPQEAEWVGPDTVRCPHCGASLGIKTERM